MLKKPELTIYLTNTCNLKCKHCYVKNNGDHELSIDNLNWLLQHIKNERTTFLGGEPMLYPYLAEAIEAFPNVNISTNGMLINEENVGILKNATGVQISLEIGKQETTFLRGEGVWESAIRAGQVLQQEKIQHYFRVGFWEGNLPLLFPKDESRMIHEFFDGTPLVLFPRLDKPPLPVELTSRLFEEVLKHEDWILALPNFLQYLRKNGRCKAGSERINILSSGKITPCNFDLEYHLGKIGDDEYAIERNIENFLRNNKIVPSVCMGCKNVEICRGSCYAARVADGCPLKYNFSIADFMRRYKVSENDMKAQALRVTNFMKRMLVC